MRIVYLWVDDFYPRPRERRNRESQEPQVSKPLSAKTLCSSALVLSMQSPSLSIICVGIAPFVCSSLAALDTNTAEATTGRLSRHSKSQTRHRISGERRSVEIPSPVPVERLTIRRDKQRSNRYPSHPPPKLSSASILASASAYSSTIPPLRGLKVNRSPPTTPYPPVEVPVDRFLGPFAGHFTFAQCFREGNDMPPRRSSATPRSKRASQQE